MSNQTLALLILLFPAAGAILLAGRGWRLPRIFTVLVGPGADLARFGQEAICLTRPVARPLWSGDHRVHFVDRGADFGFVGHQVPL